MKKNNPEFDATARRVIADKKAGEKLVLDAASKASEQMSKLLDKHFDKGAQRAAALEYHALHMGIGTMFMERVAPMADAMLDELDAKDKREGNVTENNTQQNRVMVGLWLAKVFMEIQKAVEQHEAEEEE